MLLTVPKEIPNSVAIVRIGLPSSRIFSTFCILASSVFGLPTDCGSLDPVSTGGGVVVCFLCGCLVLHSITYYIVAVCVVILFI